MIDWHRVSDLRDEVGEEDFDEIIDLFVSEVDTEICNLQPTQDAHKLESQLHFLKGSALNLGFSAFAEMCQSAESAAAQGALNDIDINAILSCYDASKSEFLGTLRRIAAA